MSITPLVATQSQDPELWIKFGNSSQSDGFFFTILQHGISFVWKISKRVQKNTFELHIVASFEIFQTPYYHKRIVSVKPTINSSSVEKY